MKKLSVVWASALVTMMVMASVTPMVATAAIPVPHNNWGTPYDETAVAMNVGELITSWIDGVEYGRNDTWLPGATVTYDVDTSGNWVTAPGDPNSPWVKEGGDLGEPIMYAWGDMTNIKLDPGGDGTLDYGIFEEYDLWWTTAVNMTDINLAALANQPPIFPKISQIVPEPTDGYPDYVFIYTEDPFFDMSGFYLEKNDNTTHGPTFALTGVSDSTAYFYANLTTMDLWGCGDELKLVWTNSGPAFGGMDIVVDRVEWNATAGGCHFTEPDNTIMTDAVAPSTGFAIHRTGTFPVYADDTNDNAADFVTDTPWPRPIIGAPIINWNIPAGGEDWTGGMDHMISFTVADTNSINPQIDMWVNYSINDGAPGTWNQAVTERDPQPFRGNGSAVIPEDMLWTVPAVDTFGQFGRLEVCVINPAGMSDCLMSAAFEIDSTPPTILTTVPADMAVDVPISQVVVITFDEPMGTTDATIVPDPGGVVLTNPTPDTLQIDHNDFAQNTYYCIFVNGTDDSVTGNAMAPDSFCFTTYLVTMPYFDFTAPAGGESWTGGSDHDITWIMGDNGTNGLADTWVWLNYSCNAVVLVIDEGLGSDPVRWIQPYTWTVPTVDWFDCFLIGTIQDFDDHLVGSDTADIPEIDSTAPTVGASPANGQTNVLVGDPIILTFNEEMNTASAEGAFSMEDTPTGTAVTGTFSWVGLTELTFTPDSALTGATQYCFTITTAAMDDSDPGNGMAADETFCFTTETTNTPPEVTVTSPVAGDLFAGGEIHLITWTLTDDTGAENLTVDVSYVYNSVTTPIPGATSLSGAVNYSWTVACPAGANADATGVTIFVEATDPGSLTGNGTSGSFTIDCTNPSGTITYIGLLEEDLPIVFSITSASETIDAYSWTFGDDGTATVAIPTHTYEKGGTYTVTCILTDMAGNTGTATATLEIESVAPDGGIMDYLWIIIIIIIVVIVAIIALVAARRRKKPEEEAAPPEEEYEEEYEEELPEEEEEVEYEEEEVVEEEVAEEEPEIEEEAAPEAAPAAPVAAAAPVAEEAAPAEEAPAGETKECPSCGTVVPGDASECFLCGATL